MSEQVRWRAVYFGKTECDAGPSYETREEALAEAKSLEKDPTMFWANHAIVMASDNRSEVAWDRS